MCLAFAGTTWAAVDMADNFDNYALGPLTGQTASNGQVWLNPYDGSSWAVNLIVDESHAMGGTGKGVGGNGVANALYGYATLPLNGTVTDGKVVVSADIKGGSTYYHQFGLSDSVSGKTLQIGYTSGLGRLWFDGIIATSSPYAGEFIGYASDWIHIAMTIDLDARSAVVEWNWGASSGSWTSDTWGESIVFDPDRVVLMSYAATGSPSNGSFDNLQVSIPAPQAATPAFTPDGGTYSEAQSVTITCATPGATIRYTTDGTDPTETNGTVIASGGTVNVAHGLMLKAKAWAAGLTPSFVKAAQYFVTVGTFVDANPSNTVPESAFVITGEMPSGYDYDNDNLWQYTADDGGLSYFLSNAIVENGPVLATTVSDLPLGTYRVYVALLVYPKDLSAYPIIFRARLNDQDWITDYSRFGTPTGVTNSWLAQTQYLLGTVRNATGFTVEIDDYYQNSVFGIYDGVVYEYLGVDTATPEFSPDAGAYGEAVNVVITCATPGATIRYTTDGSEPTETNGTVIASGSSVLVDHGLTLKARAWADGKLPSLVKSALYRFFTFADTWDDKTVFGPTVAPAGVDWNVESGLFNADRNVTVPGFGFLNPVSQGLMFNPNSTSRISVDFGSIVPETPVEARLKLMQTDGQGIYNTFGFGLKDNDPTSYSYGYYYQQNASPNPATYNASSGFHTMIVTGPGPDDWAPYGTDAPGAALSAVAGEWNYLKMIFDRSQPEGYQVAVWQAISSDKSLIYDDPSLTWQLVAHWGDIQYLDNISQFFMTNNGSLLSWAVDDVEIVCTLRDVPEAVAAPAFTPDGGILTGPTDVVISCATSGATIRYTTDGTVPTESTGTLIASGGSVNISSSTVLTARAFKSGLAASTSKSAYYYFQTLNRPTPIYYSNAVTVDGDLSDWSDATWAPLDQVYDGTPSDIAEAYYAARWGAGGQKVYVAAKVRDTAHFFTDTYSSWNGRDAIEVYIHTTGETGDYGSSQEPAQHYTLGITNSNRSAVWSRIGADLAIPVSADFTSAGREGTGADAGWLFYEAALTPFEYFGGLVSKPNVISTLSAGQIIGLDVAAVGHNGSAYTGMKAENTMTGKFMSIASLGLHMLAPAPLANVSIIEAKQLPNGTEVATSGVVSAVFTDFLNIESADRSAGIRVNKTAHGRSVGQIVDVTGTVDTLATGERYINASDVTPTGGSGNILPFALTNKALGGTTLGLQSGVEGGVGPNNIGLLIRTSGKVGTKGSGWFMIDDGSGVTVKVYGTVPGGTPYVVVTGASSCEKDGSLKIQRVIQATSIQTL